MNSIQGRLIVTLSVGCALLLGATGVLLHRALGDVLTRQFDHALQTQASALATLVTLQSDGTIDFEYNENAMPQYQRSRHNEYFIVYWGDGKELARSSSLGTATLAVPEEEESRDV